MKVNTIVILACLGLYSVAQAAIVITVDANGQQSTQYFSAGNFLVTEDGERPTFGIDAGGQCWFVDDGQRVSGKCTEMFESMEKFRAQAMAGLTERDRVIMQQMMGQGGVAQEIRVVESGNKSIAGYEARCYRVGTSREVCTSAALLEDITDEMGNSDFMDLQTKFGESAQGFGMANAEVDAVAALQQHGYPMLDLQQPGAIPGINPTMMQFIPEAQRTELMKQMGAGGGAMQGTRVVSVDKQGTLPQLDLSRYPVVGFDEYLQRMMGQMRVVIHNLSVS